MRMFWLVLYYTSVVVIPEKYNDLASCEKAGEVWVNKQFKCIPAYSNKIYIERIPNCVTNINSGKLECN